MNSRTILPPRWRDFFRGAVREALAAVNSVSRIGVQDTHAWERPLRYVVDDNQGNVGVVEFASDGLAAAVSYRARRQLVALDQALLVAPPNKRSMLAAVCGLPLLVSEGVTSIFWSEGDEVRTPEQWPVSYGFGAELFRRELLTDGEWLSEGVEYYDLSVEVARLCVAVAACSTIAVPIAALSAEQLGLLVPIDSAHRTEALDWLVGDGLFAIPDARADEV